MKSIPAIECLLIPAAEFQMGSLQQKTRTGESNELPVHAVRLSPFRMGATAVTYREWSAVVAAAPRGYDLQGRGQMGGEDRNSRALDHGPDEPITSVNWYDCAKWCNALSESRGAVPAYYLDEGHTLVYRSDEVDLSILNWRRDADGYRLPTESEWEYACLGGRTSRFFWGEKVDRRYTWFDRNSGGRTHPVAQAMTNRFGLYDMHGNVWEWCWDWMGPYPEGPVTDPTGPAAGEYRTKRGGAFFNSNYSIRGANRCFHRPEFVGCGAGFRVAASWRDDA